jgi:hypothetical protein
LYSNPRPIDRVLERLEGVKAQNGYHIARCPAHDDKKQSLSVSEGDDGRALIKCFAGCEFEEIVAALDLKPQDLFTEGDDGGGGGGVYPLGNTSPGPQVPSSDSSDGADEAGVTLESYAGYTGVPITFLKSLGLRELHYVDRPSVRMPYLDQGGEEVCVRFRVSLTGTPKIKTRKGDKHRLYGLWALEDMRESSGYVVLAEGESDAHVGWHRDAPVVGVPGATGFQSEWVEDLAGFEKVYALVEPDEGGEVFWQRLAAEADLRERLYRMELDGAKDLRELCRQDPNKFTERLLRALDGARHWMDIAESEALERARKAWELCAELAGEEDILGRFYETLRDSGVAGEESTAKILYLALTSRRLERPVSVAVKGPSSGGKSFLVERVASYFPESAIYALTAMSEKTLAYSDEPISHRFLVLYEAHGMGGDFTTYLIRSLLSEGRLRYETLEKTSEGIKPRLIEREGPTGLIVTTTMDRLHPENETRMISLLVTDTQEQTGEVLLALADEDASPPPRDAWIALQEWLEGAANRVTIPFAKGLAAEIPPVAVRLRRDFSAVLNLIRAHALLHQTSREIDEKGRVVATVEEDYAVVRELVAKRVAEGVEATVPPTVRETVTAVKDLLEGADDDEDSILAVSTQQIATELDLERSSAASRIRAAINRGFIKNLEDRRGKPGRFVLGDPMPDDVVVLPAVAELGDGEAGEAGEGIQGDTPLPSPLAEEDHGVEV